MWPALSQILWKEMIRQFSISLVNCLLIQYLPKGVFDLLSRLSMTCQTAEAKNCSICDLVRSGDLTVPDGNIFIISKVSYEQMHEYLKSC